MFLVLFRLRVGSLGIAYVTTTPQDRRTKDEGDFLFPVWPLNAAGSWEAVQMRQFLS